MRDKKRLCVFAIVVALASFNIAVADEAVVDADKTVSEAVQVEDNAEVQEASKKNTMELAIDSMSRKDYQSAIVYLTSYITAKPKKYEAYKLRGECFYALRQYKLAQLDFEKAIEIKTDDDKFITGTKVLSAIVLGADKQEQYQNPELGNLYGQLMYAQKAQNSSTYEATYQNAFKYNSHIYLPQPKKEDISKINCPQKYGKKLNPQGVEEDIFATIDAIENGKYHDAIFKAQEVISLCPKYYLGHYLLGVAMVGMEQEKEAVAAFEKALQLNPYDFESMASLGQIYYNEAEKTFSKADAGKSIEYFQKALKYNPNCYLYNYYIGLNYLQMGNYDLAISSFNTAIGQKSNDYNSLYYKLIAQYIVGDYNAVVDGTTRLIYRHVSNYNSVLYLRALAYYKQGNSEAALVDLEKIHNNMNDIYNADLKTLSPKEKKLEGYLYYLKAKIMSEKGFGVKADLDKAYANPIIAKLSMIKAVNNTQMQALLNSNFVLTYEDVDTQYDYIRTAFADLGLSFVYSNPNYKFTRLEPATTVAVKSESLLKQSSDIADILSLDNQSSIAQMLASQSLMANPLKSSTVELEDVVQSVPSQVSTAPVVEHSEKVEEVVTEKEKVEETVPQLREAAEIAETPVVEDVTEVVESVEDKVEELVEDTAQEIAEVTEKVEEVAEDVEVIVAAPESVVIEANEKKPSETFEIKYDEQQQQIEQSVETVAETAVEKVEEVQQKLTEQVAGVKEEVSAVVEQVIEDPVQQVVEAVEDVQSTAETVVENASKIAEKHAAVDLNEYNTVKAMPEIKDGDEVIEFDPNAKPFLEKAVATGAFSMPALSKTFSANSVDKAQEVQETVETVAEEKAEEVISQVEETIKVPEEMVKVAQEVEEQKRLAKEAVQEVGEVVEAVEEEVQEIAEEIAEVPEVVEEIKDEAEKTAKLKKEKTLKDFLSRAETPEQPIEEVAEVVPIGTTVAKPKKKSWFRRNKKQEVEVPEVVVDEPIQTETVEDIAETVKEEIPSAEVTESEVVEQPVVEDVKEVIEEVAEDTQDENVAIEETKEELLVSEEIKQEEKPKKSWFGWFKRNKKSEVVEATEPVVENIQAPQQPEEAEVQPIEKLEDEVSKAIDGDLLVKAEDPNLEKLTEIEPLQEEVTKQDAEVQAAPVEDVPQIRTDKAEVADSDVDQETNVSDNKTKKEKVKKEKKAKKKFVWWWNRDNMFEEYDTIDKSDLEDDEFGVNEIINEVGKQRKVDFKLGNPYAQSGTNALPPSYSPEKKVIKQLAR